MSVALLNETNYHFMYARIVQYVQKFEGVQYKLISKMLSDRQLSITALRNRNFRQITNFKQTLIAR